MPKSKQTPGAALEALLKKHGLNYNRLAKAIGLSSAMVRLIARDENPVSAGVAFSLAKFFKMKPEFWLALQLDFDISKTAKYKKLAKVLKDIPTVDKATFERKPRTTKAGAARGRKPAAKKAAARKGATRGRKPAAKKAAVRKGATRGRKPAAKAKAPAKRGKPAKKTVKTQKKTANSVTVVKKAPAARPAAPKNAAIKAPMPKKTPAKPEPAVAEMKPMPPVFSVDTSINEPRV